MTKSQHTDCDNSTSCVATGVTIGDTVRVVFDTTQSERLAHQARRSLLWGQGRVDQRPFWRMTLWRMTLDGRSGTR